MDTDKISERIKKARNNKGLTQRQVCDELNIQNVQNLSAYETGKVIPSVETLMRLSQLYDVSVDWVLFGKEYAATESKEPRELLEQLLKAVDGLELRVEEQTQTGLVILLQSREFGGIRDFATKWAKILRLYRDGMIDKEDYELWVKKRINETNFARYSSCRPVGGLCYGND